LQYKLANSCCKKKSIGKKDIALSQYQFFGGGVSVTFFVEETILKKCKTRKWQRKT